MSDKSDGLNIYSAALTALITIISAALAAAVAILQLSKDANEIFFYWAIGFLLLALISVFLAFSGLTGQAIDKNPDIGVPNITIPARLSVFCLILGLILIGFGVKSTETTYTKPSLAKEILVCRSTVSESEKIKCYDSWIDSQLMRTPLNESDLLELSDEDKNWIKTFILIKK